MSCIPMAFLNYGVSKLFWVTGQGEERSHSHSYGEELQRRSSHSKPLRSPQFKSRIGIIARPLPADI